MYRDSLIEPYAFLTISRASIKNMDPYGSVYVIQSGSPVCFEKKIEVWLIFSIKECDMLV
jgi:hypothetical protein